MKRVVLSLVLFMAVEGVMVGICAGQRKGDPSAEALAKIRAAAPKQATVKPKKPRKMLVLSYQSHNAGRFAGEKALEIMRARKFDLVLTDIKMPAMDGLALTSHVKQSNPELPVVLMTGFPSVDTAVEALRNKVDDYKKQRRIIKHRLNTKQQDKYNHYAKGIGHDLLHLIDLLHKKVEDIETIKRSTP